MLDLSSIHTELSHLHFAVRQELEGLWTEIHVGWDPYNYLHVTISCRSKNAELVADRFRHGVLNGPYDYRFRSVGREIGNDPGDWVEVTATVDLKSRGRVT